MNKINVAVLGSGGREHAIIAKFEESEGVDKVFALPGNGGTPRNAEITVSDFAGIKDFCEKESVELLFVGPENPLQDGIVNYFEKSAIKVFGPDKRASQLESSKVFAKEFMQKYGVATAEYQSFNSIEPAIDFCKKLNGNCVIKYDGLAAGKGVFVCSELSEAEESLKLITERYGENAEFLVEEKLQGQELSILAFTNGKDYQILMPSQDHKQLLEGDKGPNTGGMGAFCPVDFCDEDLMEIIRKDILDPAFKGIAAEKFNYHGVLYFGLMIDDREPKVLEFNVRLGDPETEVVLPALKTDFLKLVNACFDDTLSNLQLEFNDGYFVDVVLVSDGYPGSYKKGKKITGLNDVSCKVFHAGTKLENGNLLSNGGRVLNIVTQGKTLNEAITNCYKEVDKVKFDGVKFRKDIGSRT